MLRKVKFGFERTYYYGMDKLIAIPGLVVWGLYILTTPRDNEGKVIEL